MLSLYDELFLLAIDEEKGGFMPFAKKTVSFGLAGAILAELALKGKICSSEKQRLELVDPAPMEDEILDELLQEIATADKPRKFSYWVSHLNEHPKKLRTKVGECLAARNLVHQDDNRFYWGPLENTHNEETDLPAKYQLKNPLRESIFSGSEADRSNLALLKVINACGLLGLIFTEDELPIAKRLINEKAMHAALKDPVMQTIQEIEFAVVTSIEDDAE